jgi:hypothetical protein
MRFVVWCVEERVGTTPLSLLVCDVGESYQFLVVGVLSARFLNLYSKLG